MLKNSNFQVDHNSRWQPQRKVSLGVRRTNRFCRVQRTRMPCRQYSRPNERYTRKNKNFAVAQFPSFSTSGNGRELFHIGR
jgi:hypothetical protein